MTEYTFRWDEERSLLWAGERSYPATFSRHSMHEDIPPGSDFLLRYPEYRMETRQAVVHFENGWRLSTVWGDATYSSNRMLALSPRIPFIEEPQHVEVGVLLPYSRVATYDVDGVMHFEDGWQLWGDPLGDVSVPEYHRVADLVMHLPRDIDLPEGEWDDAQGFCDFLVTAGLERTLEDPS